MYSVINQCCRTNCCACFHNIMLISSFRIQQRYNVYACLPLFHVALSPTDVPGWCWSISPWCSLLVCFLANYQLWYSALCWYAPSWDAACRPTLIDLLPVGLQCRSVPCLSTILIWFLFIYCVDLLLPIDLLYHIDLLPCWSIMLIYCLLIYPIYLLSVDLPCWSVPCWSTILINCLLIYHVDKLLTFLPRWSAARCLTVYRLPVDLPSWIWTSCQLVCQEWLGGEEDGFQLPPLEKHEDLRWIGCRQLSNYLS